MKNTIKVIAVVIFCICFSQINAFSQTNSDDERIATLENEKRLLEKEIEKLKEIRKREAEIEKMKAELEALRASANLPSAVTVKPENQTRTGEIPGAENRFAAPSIPAAVPASSTRQVQNKCVNLGSLTQLEKDICSIAQVAIDENDGKLNYESSSAEVAGIYGTTLQTEIEKDTKNELLFDSEKKRTDKQVGAGTNSSGTTSLVVKGGAPAIIGLGIENGALTSSVSGDTVTLRLNPFNFGSAFFMRTGLLQIKDYTGNRNKDAFEEFLKKLNFGFSFDTTRGTETPTFIVSKQQLSSWSVRYEFINRRNPLSSSADITALRNNYFASQAPRIDAVTQAVLDLDSNPVLKEKSDKWINDLNLDLAANLPQNCQQRIANRATNPAAAALFESCRDRIFQIVSNHIANFPAAEVAKNEVVISQFRNLLTSQANFREERSKFLNEVNKGMVVAFEYTNNREVNAPDTSNFRFIVEKGVFAQKKFTMDFTLNAELTMYNKKPAEAATKRIKDFNLAFQTDIPLNDILQFNDSVLSFALRYTRQQGDVILPNGVVADGTKGDILFGQAKLTLPLFDTGIKLPLSLTFGNRSEFIKERFTRANFGLTFDFDQILRPLSIFR